MKTRILHFVTAGAMLLLGHSLSAAPGGKESARGGGGAPPPPSVRVGPVRVENVPVLVSGIGRVEPLTRVRVLPQVTGQVAEVLFTEGQHVRKGDLLARIDRSPYKARVAELAARLDYDKAVAANALWNYEQYKAMEKSGAATQADIQKWDAESRSSAEAVKASQAALASAQLLLDYCDIKAPTDGRVGERQVDPGNIVKANEGTPITEIVQLSPIYATFSVPERYLPQILSASRQGTMKVTVHIGGRGGQAVDGTLKFLDNQVDQQTGTIPLKAEFANADESLWPGQFVQADLVLATRQNATVVPAGAVQSSQLGSVVYVVTPDSKAVLTPVKVVDVSGTDAVVEGTLARDDRVITDGHLRVVPGGTVKVLGNEGQVEGKADGKS